MTHTPDSTLYGLMAEFDDATALVEAAQADARRGLPQDGRVLAVPDPRAVSKRCDVHDQRVPLHRAARRHRRHDRRLRAVLLGVDDRLSAEHRRPAVQQLAVVHPGDVRADDPVRLVRRGALDARAERPADAVSPGVQRAALRASPARTGSSWRSRRPIRSSIAARTSDVPARASGAREINEVAH